MSPRTLQLPPRSQISSHIQNPPTVPIITIKHNFLITVPHWGTLLAFPLSLTHSFPSRIYQSDGWIWGNNLGLLAQTFSLSCLVSHAYWHSLHSLDSSYLGGTCGCPICMPVTGWWVYLTQDTVISTAGQQQSLIISLSADIVIGSGYQSSSVGFELRRKGCY